MSENDLLCNLGLHKLPQVEGLVRLLGDHFEFLLLVWQLEGCSAQAELDILLILQITDPVAT